MEFTDHITPEHEAMIAKQAIFDIAVESVQTSCGWGVPVMHLDKRRETLPKYHAQQDPAVWAKKVGGRTRSIDGLPTRASDRFIAGS